MEMSLLRAEKLVNDTNLALEQMNHNLTFDDFSKKPGARAKKEMVSGKMNQNLSWKQEFKKLENDFKSEASEMLTKMEKLLNFYGASSSPSSKVHNKEQEINKNTDKLIIKEKESKDLESSQQKLLDLINNDELITKETPESCISANYTSKIGKPFVQVKEKLEANHEKIDSLSCPSSLGKRISREKSKELREKLLETQQIVDRGVQTARRLTQKVENMAKNEKKVEKTPSTIKTESSEISLRNWNEEKKTKSKDSVENEYKSQGNKESSKKKLKTKKLHQHCLTDNLKLSKNKKENQEECRKNEKNVIISVRQIDRREFKEPKLQLQHLPSLYLKGNLQVQKIHNLEISPQNRELKVNTGFSILCHDDIQREEKVKLLENVKKENSFYCEKKISDSVFECLNCGKITRMQHRYLDPRKVDEILAKCNFNVFDPKIDEFVGILNENGRIPLGVLDEDSKNTSKKSGVIENSEVEKLDKEKTESLTDLKVTRSTNDKRKSAKTGVCIKQLSEELSKKYKEKVRDLEQGHLQLENILQDLYEEIYESSDFFNSCSLLSFNKKRTGVLQKMKRLTLTKPVVISFCDKNDSSLMESPKKSSGTNALERQEKNEQKSSSRTRKQKRSRPSMDRKIKVSRLKKIDRKQAKAKTVATLPSFCAELKRKNTLNFYSKVENKEQYNHSKAFFQAGKSNMEREEKNSTLDNIEGTYESDFEKESLNENFSLTNEIFDNVNKEKNEDINKCNKVLSLISEADYELGKKSKCLDDKKENSLKDSSEVEKDVSEAGYSKNPGDEIILEHEKSKDTPKIELVPEVEPFNIILGGGEETKVKKKQKSEGSEKCSSSSDRQSRKSSSAEVVTSLKEILSALKVQFEKTQSLADKLTINVETLNGKREEVDANINTGREPVLNSRQANGHLNSFKNEVNEPFSLNQLPIISFGKTKTPEKQEIKVSSVDNSSPPVIWPEKETQKKLVYSAGEMVCREPLGSLRNSESHSGSEQEFSKLSNESKLRLSNAIPKEKSYSDGEIPSQILLGDECSSTHSVGEVISEIISEASNLD